VFQKRSEVVQGNTVYEKMALPLRKKKKGMQSSSHLLPFNSKTSFTELYGKLLRHQVSPGYLDVLF
jgi:hypothetical protein